jgi:iron-sulfur cluster repair protein YtfE (RIC family)
MSAAEDVLTLLTRQHRQLEELLRALLAADPPSGRATLLARAADELAVHMGAEEAVFYPAIRAARTEDILLESLEEHLSLKRLLADLLALPPDEITFEPKCKVLQEQAEHHHKEEEQHLFPKVRHLFDARRRRQLGRQVQAHENSLHAPGAPRRELKTQTAAAEPLSGPAPSGPAEVA